ncbi:MAG TPA: MCP four helix bundle domain-containing protein, partial [Reyranella sp.]|nr:MCP four helix bundle domain-containing protein [Reyranella sp.]
MRFTIKAKLATAFSLMVVLLLGIAVYGMINLGSFNQTITDIVKGPVERLKLAQQVSIDISDSIAAQKTLLLATSPSEIEAALGDLNRSRSDFDATVMRGEAASDASGKQIWEEVRTLGDQFDDIGDRIAQMMKQGSTAAAKQLSEGEALTVSNKVHDAVANLIAVEQTGLQKADDDADQQYAFTNTTTIAVSVLAFVIAVGAALWIAIGVSRGLASIKRVIDAVAIGDLDQRIEIRSNDEIKDVVDQVNVMTENLRASAAVADQIAYGDLSADPKPLSEKDTLGLSMARMVESLRSSAGIVDQIAGGDLSADPKPLSDKDILGHAMVRMVESLRGSAHVADQIADGDLTVKPQALSEKDTLGLALVRMVERLRDVIGDATEAARNVASGSQEMSATAEQLSQGASEQASSTEEASASMEEMAATIKQSADNAGQT